MAFSSAPNVVSYTSAGTSMTVANPAHATGDYLLALAIGRNAAATFVAPTQDGGWTQVGSEVNQGVLSVAWFYIKATSSSMTAPSTSHASTQYRALLVFNIGDGDPTTFIDTGFGTSGVALAYDTDTSTDGMTCASGTTTANNCLIMHVAVNDAPRNLEIMPKSMRLLNTVNVGDNLQYCVSWVFQETAGATDTWTIHQTRAINDALSVAIAIRSDAPRVPARHDSSTAQAEIILAYNNQGDGGLPYTDTNIASDLGTIDSITTNDATFANATGSGFNPYMTHLMLSSSTAGQIATQHYLRDSGVNYDCSSGKVSIGFMLQSGESLSRIETLANHGVMVGLTSGTSPKEIAMWDAGGFDTSPIEVQTVIVDANSYIEHEVNNFDWTDVRGFVVAAHLSVGANTRVSLDYVHKLGTIVLIGGWNEAGKSASWSTARTAALSASAKTIDKLGDAYRTKQDIQVGNGGTNAVYFDTNGESLFLPRAGSVASGDMQMQAAGVAVTLYGVSGDTIKLNDPVVSAGNAGDTFTIHASSTSSATWEFNGTISGFVTDDAVSLRNLGAGAYAGLTFLGCGEIAHNNADLTGGVTFDGCTGTQAITITAATQEDLQTALDRFAGATFQNSTTYGMTIDATSGSGDFDLVLPANTNIDELFFDGPTGSTLTIEIPLTGSIDNATASAGETVTLVEPTSDITVTSNVAASIWIFTAGTQTIIASDTAATSLAYTYTGTPTYDVVVAAAGYLPQRIPSQAMTGADANIDVELIADPSYNASHGLTYTTDFSYNRSTKKLTISTRSPGRDIHSAMIDAFLAQSSLLNTPYPIRPNGPDSFIFLDDAEIIDSTSEDKWHDAGIRYLATGGTVTKEGISFKSVGSNTTGETGEYQQVDGSGTTDARATGNFDQLIWVYGDASHGNFDYRDHLVAKFQINGFREARVDVLSAYGISALEPLEYVVSLSPLPITAATGDPAATITLTKETSPVTWNSKDFSITIQSSASGETILRELNYNLSLDATYSGLDPFNWPEMVIEAGSGYETVRGIVEGDGTPTYHGVRVLNGSGDPHPDFTRFQADDGTYFTPDVTNSASVTDMPTDGANIRLQIFNVTKDALVYDDDPGGSSYSDSYVEGTDYSAGDVIRVRFAELNAGTSFKYDQQTVIATSSGFSVAISVTSDPVYASNALNGSTYVDRFTADTVGSEIELNADTDFTAAQAFAFYCYTLTTSAGMAAFWGGVTAVDSANYRINTAVLDLYFNETVGAFVKQTDNARIFRDDGARPARDPTTGGYGLEVNWKNPVYTVATGSALSSEQNAKLMGLPSASAVRSEVDSNSTQLAATVKLLKNKVTTDPTLSKMTVYDDDGTTPLYEADLYDDVDGSTPWTGDAAINRRDALT